MERTQLGREFFELGLGLGRLGTVLIGSGGGSLARALARAAGCGAALAGGEVKFHDGGCAACGTWLARYYQYPAALFVRQDGARVERFLTDGRGRPLTPPDGAGEEAPCAGEWDMLAGADCAWAACRVGERRTPGGLAAAEGPAALTLALERLGYEVADRPVPGAVLFRADREGLSLTVEQGGLTFRPVGEDALEAAASYVDEPQAVPAFRPDGGGTEQK